MKVAIYIRVATIEQTAEGQRNLLMEHARTLGWEVKKVYEDIASARDMFSRRALQNLILDTESASRDFDAVLVHGVDRLTRDSRDLFSLLETFRNSAMKLITPRGEIKCELPFILG
ncbi:recombinase family protein [Paenibacillus ginsengarvi]|nr:recombinase family protein [Paenibacillus ginsengarvi]